LVIREKHQYYWFQYDLIFHVAVLGRELLLHQRLVQLLGGQGKRQELAMYLGLGGLNLSKYQHRLERRDQEIK
jgi:hypothetical protein